MSGVMAEEIRSSEALLGLEPAWWRLWRRCETAGPAGATPFQSPAWLLPWWASFSPGSLCAVAVWSGAELVGLAPLYREDGPGGSKLLPVGISLSDYVDVLADPDHLAEVLAAVSEHLGRQACRVVNLVDLRPGATATRLPPPAGWRAETGACEACPVLDLTGPGEREAGAPPATVPARKRRKVRMAQNRAERRGAVAIATAGDVGADRFLDEVERLHGSRWRSRGEAGVLADDRVRAFHRAALPKLMEAGLADTALLLIGGEVAGAYYGLRDRARAYAYVGGFDPAFERESPGTILLARTIAEAADRGAREFHFLRGREPYKYEWGAVDRPNAWLTLRADEASP